MIIASKEQYCSECTQTACGSCDPQPIADSVCAGCYGYAHRWSAECVDCGNYSAMIAECESEPTGVQDLNVLPSTLANMAIGLSCSLLFHTIGELS